MFGAFCSRCINDSLIMETRVQQISPQSSSMTGFALWHFTEFLLILCNFVVFVPFFFLFFFAAVVGLLYPCLDSHLGEPHKFKREWASVMRCIAVFVGINHASVVSFHTELVSEANLNFCTSLVVCQVGVRFVFLLLVWTGSNAPGCPALPFTLKK